METASRKKPVSPADGPFQQALGLHKQEKFAEALPLYRQALELDMNHVPAWRNLGSALRKLGHFEASRACLYRSLELGPNVQETLTNLGNCLVDMDEMEPALQMHADAVKVAPNEPRFRKNYAIALRKFGKFEEALEQFDVADKLQPNDKGITWERATIYLNLGRLREGFEAMEVRWKMGLKDRDYPVPRWQGEDLKGKTILIYKEQGFGDTILCARYIPMVKALGCRVILECQKPLHRLFAPIAKNIDKMIEQGADAGEPFDYHTPMMSLAWIFKTEISSIPKPPPLFVPDAPPPVAQQLLDVGKGRFKVGIVWSGSVTFLDNAKRSVTAEHFLQLAEVSGVQLYSLQKGPREKDLEDYGAEGPILPLGPHLNDFADTAAALQQLDLVIMTDSSVAHLAGSLNRPIWNLLHYSPYWLYQRNRSDCPWYPSMRLFRQPKPGDWDSVFKEVAAELKKNVKNK